jgi:hypothetical protein
MRVQRTTKIHSPQVYFFSRSTLEWKSLEFIRLVGSRSAYRVVVRGPKEIDHLEDIGVDGKNVKWIFKKQAGTWTGLI